MYVHFPFFSLGSFRFLPAVENMFSLARLLCDMISEFLHMPAEMFRQTSACP